MKCVVCGAETLAPVLKVVPFDGLPHVYLKDIEVRECPSCHETYEAIPALETLIRRLVRFVVEQPQPLTGQRLEFLRKSVGWSVEDMAKRLGVAPHRLSVWEASEQPPPQRVQDFVRVVAANSKPVESYEKMAKHRPAAAVDVLDIYFKPRRAAAGVSWGPASMAQVLAQRERADAK